MLSAKLSKIPEHERQGKVIVVTMTDGLENASQEYTAAQIAELIKHQREAYKWEFLFLGANQDAILTGEKLNIPRANSVRYAACAMGGGKCHAGNGSECASFRKTGSRAGLHHTDGQRRAAVRHIDDEKTTLQNKKAIAQPDKFNPPELSGHELQLNELALAFQ